MNRNDIVSQEILHSQKILSKAEVFWGWETPSGKNRAERRGNIFIEFGRIRGNKKILELGCGTGVFTKKLKETGAHIDAIDISPYFIKKARQNIKAKNVTFLVGDAGQMKFKDNSYDCVVGSSILHHLVEVKSCLQEIKRVLKKGGRFVFTEPNMANPVIIIIKKVKPVGRLLGESSSETAFFKWQITNLFRETGFRAIFVEPFDFLHPWIPRFLVSPAEKIGQFLEKMPVVKEIAGSLIIYGEK